MDISVIIPVFNGVNTITELYGRIKKALNSKYSFEIIFIHDCGNDQSWDIIQDLVSTDPLTCKGFHLKQNYGQHNAILFGMKKAGGKFIITMDEDLQHDPNNIPDLILKQVEGDYDVVYGKFEKLEHPFFRKLTSGIMRFILLKMIPGLHPEYSSYRLIKKQLAEKITENNSNPFIFIDGEIGLKAFTISWTPVKHSKRTEGTSSYSTYKLIRHSLNIILGYSFLKHFSSNGHEKTPEITEA
jgi:undecaprenyl-phosphate 4-deoxy-4-formamido-L-arabinose transferase